MAGPLMLFAIVAIGGLFVFLPMAKRNRYKRVVNCPEVDKPAEILVDTSHASSPRPRKKPWTIRNCSLWPKKKGCTQSCIK